jgi:hypothetical protein
MVPLTVNLVVLLTSTAYSPMEKSPLVASAVEMVPTTPKVVVAVVM